MQSLSLSGSQFSKEKSWTAVYGYTGCTLNNSEVAFHAKVNMTAQGDKQVKNTYM